MQSVFELLGWFVFNVAIPLLAPLALLPLIMLFESGRRSEQNILEFAVRDGQPLWAVIPMSASACYMLAVAIDVAGAGRQLMWLAMTMHVTLIVLASAMVMLVTMNAYQRSRLRGAPNARGQVIRRGCMFLTAFSGGLHFLGYVFLIRPAGPA